MTDKKPSEETLAADVADADLWAGVKGGSDVKFTFAQVKTWIKAWIVKGDVGLTNVDNTSDENKPVSTAQQTALDLKANLAGPTFTGAPAAPTASAGTNTTQLATTAFVKAAVDVVLGGVSAAFDTLSEIATSLGVAGQRPATATNDSATAGNVGEYATATQGSAQALTNNTALTITSVSLTAGDWDVSGTVGYAYAATTVAQTLVASISLTNNMLDTTLGRLNSFNFGSAGVTPKGGFTISTPMTRLSLASTTTVFLIAQSGFTTSTTTATGTIRARRVR